MSDRDFKILLDLKKKELVTKHLLNNSADSDTAIGKMLIVSTEAQMLTNILDQLQINDIPIDVYLSGRFN